MDQFIFLKLTCSLQQSRTKWQNWKFGWLPLRSLMVAWLAHSLVVIMGDCKQINCDFNQMCLCQNYTAQYIDVTCVNVPLVSVPIFKQFQHLYRIRIIGARELTQLNPDNFQNLITLASLTISKSRLSYINPETFKYTSIRHTLTTVDLSYGNLIEIPVNALTNLHQLQWLSLKGNQIELIRAKDLTELKTLKTLFLNENLLSIVEDRTFHKLPNLELIDFNANMIERIEGNPFPSSLKSLYLSNCLLRKIPFSSVQNLPNLEVLQLQGNLISHLSPFKLKVKKMELIDLSHNLIANLPNNLFTNYNQQNSKSFADNANNNNYRGIGIGDQTNKNSNDSSQSELPQEHPPNTPLIHIQKFHLDFNFIQSIPSDLFRDILIEKLTLSSNRISSLLISANSFQGPLETGLKVLDLNYNLIDKYPIALKSLRALRQLLLKNNRINEIDADAFLKCSDTLEVLDISQNMIEKMPKSALTAVKNIIKINLHGNLIKQIHNDDLSGWCHQLKSLTLSKNNLITIEAHAFRACTMLNELRLGGNQFLQFSHHSFIQNLNQLQLLGLSSLDNVNSFLRQIDQNTIQSLPKVKWLQFDFNLLKTIPPQLIKLFPSLMYFDLQNNIISQLPNNLNKIKNLTTIILSHNNLTSIPSGAFVNQTRLESVAIYFNRIRMVRRYAFDSLPKLQSLVLSKNQISHIEADAFYNLSYNSNSVTLMLDENKLDCLSFNSFRHIADQKALEMNFSLYLNVSHNQIKTFADCPESDKLRIATESDIVPNMSAAKRNQPLQTLPIRVLDLSFNQIPALTVPFLSAFCSRALSLFANNNLIRLLSVNIFSHCPHLQTLSLNYNHISSVRPKTETDDKLITERTSKTNNDNATNDTILQIQTLSLQFNKIKDLTSFEPLFNQLGHLKSLDLMGNQIREIPFRLFARTSLVKLNLSHNQLRLEQHKDKCFGIMDSLKYVDISYNSLAFLPEQIISCVNLIELLASNNRIHSLNYITPVLSNALPQLYRLDLYDNPVESSERQIRFTFVNNHSMLTSLNLNNLNIIELEELNVPYLYTLELSGNSISTINTKILARSRNIRHLNLAYNKLQEVPKQIWKYVTRLRYLDLSENPIDVLDSSSFAGLKYLRHLDIRGLKLQYIDARIFLHQSQLTTLKISTYPQIRSFRLQDILSKSDALKTVVIDVKESILSHQIQWAFGRKLRQLIVTGQNLVHILPDAFQGLNNANDLILRVTNTSIRQLPDGLLQYLADIRYITMDLRNNQLETVKPSVFFARYDSNINRKTWQSRQLLGGIILENNPLKCDCNLLWFSKWMKEIFTEMKSINIEAAIHAKAALALSQCHLLGRTNKRSELSGNTSSAYSYQRQSVQIPIIHLQEENMATSCEMSNSVWSYSYNVNVILLRLSLIVSMYKSIKSINIVII